MLLKEFEKASLWKVIGFFARTNLQIHIKGLAKKLGISASDAHRQLNVLEKNGFLEKQKIGNMVLYSLKEADPLVLEFKRLVFLLDAMPFFQEFSKQNSQLVSLAVFGSIAKGVFDKKSDIDVLVISQDKKLDFSAFEELEFKLGMEVKPAVYTFGDWRNLANNKNPFVESILNNHILLSGAEL